MWLVSGFAGQKQVKNLMFLLCHICTEKEQEDKKLCDKKSHIEAAAYLPFIQILILDRGIALTNILKILKIQGIYV